MGQLLVVVRHTVFIPSSCYEPELIPDPVWNADSFASQYHNAGSGISVVTAGLTAIVQVAMHGRHDHKARMSGPPERDNN